MSMRIRRSITTAIVLALATTSAAMTWRDGPEPLRRTHPSGSRDRRVHGYLGRPFGIHVTSQGAILVTQQDVNVMRKLTPNSAPQSFEVGEDPGDVVATRDGEVA